MPGTFRGPTFWLGEKDSPIEIPSSGIAHESYDTVRERAFEKPNSAAVNDVNDGDREIDVLRILVSFYWSKISMQICTMNLRAYHSS